MKNKSKLLVTALLVGMTWLCIGGIAINRGEQKCTSLIIDGGDKTIGRNDENYRLAEKYSTDAEIYAEIQEAAYSTSVIETLIRLASRGLA